MFTLKELQTLTVIRLKEIYKEHNIKPGLKSTKEQIVDRIVKRSKTMNGNISAVNDLLHVLKQPAIKDSALLHNFYHAHFNLNNLTDCKWYAVEKCHPNQ